VTTVDTGSLLLVKLSAIVLIGLITSSAIVHREAASLLDMPEKLAGLKAVVTLSDDEIEKLKAGQPVTKILDATVNYEVAVFGAEWIDVPAYRYVRAMQDIEHFEKGESFLVTKRISDSPRLQDFAALNLTDEDVADLKTCRVGYCKLKMGKDAITRFHREIDWSKPTASEDARALFRKLALQYVTAYKHGGNRELPVYQDKHLPTVEADDFASIVDEMSPLLQNVPSLRQYLLNYPNAQLSKGTSFFYWQQVDFGLKPTVRINHVAISEGADNIGIASKLLYADHYFLAALELQVLIPDSSWGQGFWLITVRRLRSDGLSGSAGPLLRKRIQKDAVKGLTEALQTIKSRLGQVK
jgi:hypothetical protein